MFLYIFCKSKTIVLLVLWKYMRRSVLYQFIIGLHQELSSASINYTAAEKQTVLSCQASDINTLHHRGDDGDSRSIFQTIPLWL